MYFSFAAVFRLLREIKQVGVTDYSLCSYVFWSFEPAFKEANPDLTNKIISCKQNVPAEVADGSRGRDFVEIKGSLESEVLPCLDSTMYNQFVLAVRDLLASDTSILETTMFCRQSKTDLVNSDYYIFSDFLTDVLIFAVRRDNKKGKNDLSKLETNLAKWNDKATTITVSLASGQQGAYSDLPLSINPEKFYQVFKELKNSHPFINAESEARFFYLNVADFKFDYVALTKYLRRIAAEYACSREELKKAKENTEDFTETISNAFSELRKKEYKPEILGQILIYSFLESVLHAPKIMSKFEQEKSWYGRELKCEGIHLLYLPNEPKGKRYQLVIGSSTLQDDAETAIKEAVSKLSDLAISGSSKIRGILHENTLRLLYNDELKLFLKRVFYPSGFNSATIPRTSYGVFVGYSVSVDSEICPDEDSFCLAIEDRMKRDIQSLIPKAEEEIRAAKGNLAKTPIYFYFVPFNSALIDAKSILKDFLE